MNIVEVIQSGDYLVLDTETTGLDAGSEICQIAIIDSTGKPLLDTLVKPVQPIPAEATAIHGITNETVKNAPPFPYQLIRKLLNGKSVIVYNAEYDIGILQSSTDVLGFTDFRWVHTANFYCAMKHFAQIYGDWNDYHQSYRWQKLSTACAYYKIPVTKAHGALEDCLATLEVCKAMVSEKVIK